MMIHECELQGMKALQKKNHTYSPNLPAIHNTVLLFLFGLNHFLIFIFHLFIISLTTSLAISNPATDGTKEMLAGVRAVVTTSSCE